MRRQIHPASGRIQTFRTFADSKNIQPVAGIATGECDHSIIATYACKIIHTEPQVMSRVMHRHAEGSKVIHNPRLDFSKMVSTR